MTVPIVGLAVSSRSLVAMRWRKGASPGEVWRRGLEAGLGNTPQCWAEVRAALAEMGGALETSSARLAVVLAPPLVQVRALTFPRLRESEMGRVVARDVARYFPGVHDAQVVAVASTGKVPPGQIRVLAAAAPAWLLDGLSESAGATGFTIVSFEPAHVAWARWARGRGSSAIVVLTREAAEVIGTLGRKVSGVRRTPCSAHRIAAAVAELGETAPALFADDPASLCEDLGAELVGPTHASLAAAAAYAGSPSALELVLPAEAAARARRVRRVAGTIWLSTAAVLLVALGLHWGALSRELRVLERARQAHSAEVEEAMKVREASLRVAAQLEVVVPAADAPRWTMVLEQIATTLPRDAYLTAFRAVGDSILMEGVARRAVGVFEGLAKAEPLARVRPGGPIRQEVRDSGPPIERFVAAAVARKATEGRKDGKPEGRSHVP